MSEAENKYFDNPQDEQAYENLLKELRCMTCPNQSIADSHAPVAIAMQDEIYQRLKQHETPEKIREALVSSYGDFISYKPVLKLETYGLWFGPLLMFAVGVLLWFGFFKRKENHVK